MELIFWTTTTRRVIQGALDSPPGALLSGLVGIDECLAGCSCGVFFRSGSYPRELNLGGDRDNYPASTTSNKQTSPFVKGGLRGGYVAIHGLFEKK